MTATTDPARGHSGARAAVTAAGILTVLWGVGAAWVGGSLLLASADGFADAREGRAGGWGWLIQIVAGVTVVVGVGALLAAAVGVTAGVGTIRRRQWGRFLAIAVGVLAASMGLGYFGENADGTDIALGIGHLLYGLFTVITLCVTGREFARPRSAAR